MDVKHGWLRGTVRCQRLSGLIGRWGNPYEYLDLTLRVGKSRRDGKLKPINSDFDLYSRGQDGDSKGNLDSKESLDDIVRAFDGHFINLDSKFSP